MKRRFVQGVNDNLELECVPDFKKRLREVFKRARPAMRSLVAACVLDFADAPPQSFGQLRALSLKLTGSDSYAYDLALIRQKASAKNMRNHIYRVKESKRTAPRIVMCPSCGCGLAVLKVSDL